MAEITIRDERIFYVCGAGTDVPRPSILLLHGAGQSSATWKYQAGPLTELGVYNIVIPDLPGHGSSGGGGRRTVAGYADFVEEFVSELNLKDLIIVGHSMGGAVAMLYALRRPGDVMACVLAGSGARLRVAPESLDAAKNSYGAFCETASRRMIAESSPQQVRDEFKAGMLGTDPDVCYNDLLACDEFDVMEEVSRISTPTLIISATEDILTPVKYGEYLNSKMQNSVFHAISSSGHFMMQEKPGLFNLILLDFLNELPPFRT